MRKVEFEKFTVYEDGRIIWKKFPRISKHLIGKDAGSYDAYAGYIRYYSAGVYIFNHITVWESFNGEIPDGMYLDHIDGNRLNNSLSNLRVVTSKGNSRNLGRSKANTSGVTGVRFDKERGRWAAGIKVSGKTIFLGRYHNFEDALSARKDAEERYGFHDNHGERSSWNVEEGRFNVC